VYVIDRELTIQRRSAFNGRLVESLSH